MVQNVSNHVCGEHEWVGGKCDHDNFLPIKHERGGGFGGFLPGVIGCVDSTHIKIQAPHENENGFFNRKGFHSMNVQAICNHKAR